MQAYTYSIRHLPSNKIYYGVRKSTIVDIGTKYFSSSKIIKQLMQTDPLENFEFKVRRKFLSYSDARLHETKVLKRIKAVSNPLVLNQAVSSPRWCSKDPVAELRRKESISATMKKLWADPEYRANQHFNKLSTEERVKRAKAGNAKRTEYYTLGILQRKPKKAKAYKDVEICKNGMVKTVKANQVPAYAKSGWTRLL